jgi:hypothetical protein
LDALLIVLSVFGLLPIALMVVGYTFIAVLLPALLTLSLLPEARQLGVPAALPAADEALDHAA